MKNMHFGKCALCGQECKLTFEHIPPCSAFNSLPARPVSGLDLLTEKNLDDESRLPWETSGLHYQNQQKGNGRYSLCSKCNNNTGSWYGDAYVNFAKTAHSAIVNCPEDDVSGITFQGIYPLRFAKQVLSMFCSSCSPDSPLLDPIRKFVLDKDAIGLDKNKYKLCMYLTKSTLVKQTGIVESLKFIDDFKTMTLSEITAYPFGFVLYLDASTTWDYHGIDITSFADFVYDDIRDVTMPWKIEEMNDIFPELYRSREEIMKQREETDQGISNEILSEGRDKYD